MTLAMSGNAVGRRGGADFLWRVLWSISQSKLNKRKFAKAQLLTKNILSLSSSVIVMFMCISLNQEKTCGSKKGWYHNKAIDLSRALLAPFTPLIKEQGEHLPPCPLFQHRCITWNTNKESTMRTFVIYWLFEQVGIAIAHCKNRS